MGSCPALSLEKRSRKVKKRIATRVSRGAAERRLTGKKIIGQNK